MWVRDFFRQKKAAARDGCGRVIERLCELTSNPKPRKGCQGDQAFVLIQVLACKASSVRGITRMKQLWFLRDVPLAHAFFDRQKVQYGPCIWRARDGFHHISAGFRVVFRNRAAKVLRRQRNDWAVLHPRLGASLIQVVDG